MTAFVRSSFQVCKMRNVLEKAGAEGAQDWLPLHPAGKCAKTTNFEVSLLPQLLKNKVKRPIKLKVKNNQVRENLQRNMQNYPVCLEYAEKLGSQKRLR